MTVQEVLRRVLRVCKIVAEYNDYEFDGITGVSETEIEFITCDAESAFAGKQRFQMVKFPVEWLFLADAEVHALAKVEKEAREAAKVV